MRITKKQLQDLINEEISRALLRSENHRLIEAVSSYGDTGHGSLYDLDASELLEFAQSYVSLGAAVQEQLEELLDMQEDADINPNALQLIEDRLGGMNAEIDGAIQSWKTAR
jgi:hypothetical protein